MSRSISSVVRETPANCKANPPIIAKSIKIKEAYGQIFNIGADIPYAVNFLSAEVIKAMGATEKYPVNHLPPRNEVVDAYSAHEKAQRILGYKTNHTLQQGLKNQAEWALKNGAKKSKEFDNIEITEKLPPSWDKK